MTRLAILWGGVRDSLWFIPALFTAGAVGLALVTARLDAQYTLQQVAGGILIFTGGADGARGVLTAVAGSLITVTGVVFSVTIVALQLASSQFTPRVLRGFMADRVNQTVLGIFIGTFTYAVMVLRTVTSPDDGAAFVPQLGVTLAIALVIVSIGALIYFINHAARSVQASVILTRETEHTLRRIERLFPRGVGEPMPPPRVVRAPSAPGAVVLSGEAGYLLAVHVDALFEVAERHRLTIRMEHPIGGFVLPGEPLATVWPREAAQPDDIEAIRTAFVMGEERTPEQDAELGIIVIADIAVRALSPGVNDPTTAMLCIDRLTEILVALGTSPDPVAVRTNDAGELRFLARQTTFERAVGLAFDQIRHYGAENPGITKKLVDSLARIGTLVPPDRRPALAAQVTMLMEALEGGPPRAEHAAVRRLATDSLRRLAAIEADPTGDPPARERGPGALTHR